MPALIFISDLHLCASRPYTFDLFANFMRTNARASDGLYILGDLFEYWVGDDDMHDTFVAPVVAALKDLSAHVPVSFMHGNRDFLVGDAFFENTGVTHLTDPTMLRLAGQSTLLVHGDMLNPDDVAYHQFRAQVRSAEWQTGFLAKPLAERRTIAQDIRRQSEKAKQTKPMRPSDVALDAVAALLRAHGYPRLIHGHTHRPARHVHQIDQHSCERWVLSDWDRSGSYLRCDEAGLRYCPVEQ